MQQVLASKARAPPLVHASRRKGNNAPAFPSRRWNSKLDLLESKKTPMAQRGAPSNLQTGRVRGFLAPPSSKAASPYCTLVGHKSDHAPPTNTSLVMQPRVKRTFIHGTFQICEQVHKWCNIVLQALRSLGYYSRADGQLR